MTDNHHQRLAKWFEEALHLDGAERDACLARCRAEAPELHDELCELLDHDTRAAGALDAGLDSGAVAALAAEVVASSGGAPDDADALAAGQEVGPYTVARRLGAGGFAVVYEARQREPVTRDVALKVLRPGMETKQVVARFAAELQAQARMSHEHVARVFDAGTTSEGRPYLAMELVEGLPITHWCEARCLGLRARLELFVQACDAVQHAHQKGVIHRDIKPSNVLVTGGGAHGSVKIIDFGIAKAIEGSLTEDTLRTLEGQLVGTPESMSPEQADGRGDDIDTRTDVYALGVLLYELLAGVRPFDFQGKTLVEIQRTILEVDPPRPVSGSSQGLADAAWQRALNSDLDWVVMRALEKDPARRYEAVAGLAADVQRFLRDEPVEASPPSRAYRVRKFVRRNRTGVTAAALVLISLTAGLAWALVERARADTAATNESLAKGVAQERADEFEKVSVFQERQFLDLDTSHVGRRIDAELRTEVEAALRRRLGTDEAAEAEVASRLAQLDDLLQGASFTNIAVDTLDDAFLQASIASVDEQFADEPRIRTRLLRAAAQTQAMMGLVQESLPIIARAHAEALTAYGPDHPETVHVRMEQAETLAKAGENERAAREFDELIELTDGRADLVWFRFHAIRGRAGQAKFFGDHDLSRKLFQDMHDLAVAHYGPEDSAMTGVHAELASIAEDPQEAEKHYLAAIEGTRREHGPDHERVYAQEDNYAGFLNRTGRRREAREIRERCLEGFRKVLGDRHRTTLRSMESLGLMFNEDNDKVAAEALIREAYDVRVATYGPDNIETLGTGGNLAMVLAEMGRSAESVEIYAEVLPGQRAVVGLEHQDTLGTMTNLALAYNNTQQYQEAADVMDVCLPVKRRVLGLDHAFTHAGMAQAMTAYKGVGRDDEARKLNAEYIDLLVRKAEKSDASAEDVGHAAEALITSAYNDLLDPKRALPLATRAVELEEEHGGSRMYTQLSRLALAHWYLQDVKSAVEVQKRVVETAPDYAVENMRSLLAWYEERLKAEPAGGGEDGE